MIRKPKSKSSSPWTPEQDAVVISMRNRRIDFPDIAAAMGDAHSSDAVRQRVTYLRKNGADIVRLNEAGKYTYNRAY